MLTIKHLMLCITAAVTLLAMSEPSIAHEDHDTSALTGAASAPAGAPLTLSPETIANLDVKTATAELRPLPDTLSMPATVALLPEKQAQVTTRFDGRIQEIKVKIGETTSRFGGVRVRFAKGHKGADDRRIADAVETKAEVALALL